jgi:hypothetical protein
MLPALLGIGSLISGFAGSLFGDKKTETTTKTEDSTTNNTGSKLIQGGTQELSDPLMSMLSGAFEKALSGGGLDTATSALGTRLSQVQADAAKPAFDVESFVSGITSGARSDINAGLESDVNSLASSTGTSSGDNSMTALLTNRLRSDAAAKVAATEASARSSGEQIRQAQQQGYSDQINQLGNSLSGQILSLIEQTKGAQSATTQTDAENTQSVVKAKANETTVTKNSSNPFAAFSNLFSVLGKSAAAA